MRMDSYILIFFEVGLKLFGFRFCTISDMAMYYLARHFILYTQKAS